MHHQGREDELLANLDKESYRKRYKRCFEPIAQSSKVLYIFLKEEIMGMFDTFNVDDCDGQVKMFDCNMDTFNIGDKVCKLGGTYSIRLRFGKWVNITRGIWSSYTELPESDVRFNKWGGEWDDDDPVYD